jgi:hypothetical protein
LLCLADVSSFKRVSRHEHCRHLVSALPCRWISKFRQRSAASANFECQPNSDTHTYSDVDSNRNRQPDTCSNANTSCHSTPAFGPAHFALTRALGRQLRSQIPNRYDPCSRDAPFEILADSTNQKPAEVNTKAGLCWFDGWPSE